MILELKNLNKDYGKNRILDDICYKFEDGKIYGLIGQNGVGKTTLLNCIANKVGYEGRIIFDGNAVKYEDVTYVLSTPKIPLFLTGREFLTFFLVENNIGKTVDECFELFQIKNEDRDKLMLEYSDGTKSKIQLFINLISNNKIILLDEPFAYIDMLMSEKVKDIIKKMKKDHIIIITIHSLDIAAELCDEILLLNDRKLFETGGDKKKIVSILKQGEINV